MVLSIAEIDRISREIRDYYRQESASVQIQKIRGNFYESVKEALESLEEMARTNVSPEKIDAYRRIMDKKDIMEKNLRNFLLKRYEKILRDSLFEIGSTVLEKLTQQEKRFIMEKHNEMQDYIESIVNPGKQTKVEAESQAVVEKVQTEHHKESNDINENRVEGKLVPVAITVDYLPVATSFGDFYFHKNDIAYIPEESAQLVLARKFGHLVITDQSSDNKID